MDDESVVHVLELRPSGVLRGRVTSGGDPVSDFEVVAWQAGQDPHSFMNGGFRNRSDGSFVIEGTPLGEVLVLAFSQEHARSQAVQVSISKEAPGEVEIELPANVLGRGRVVDAVGGGVPSGAVVQAWSNYGGKLLMPSGNPLEVGLDGAFEIPTLGQGDCRFEVTAPGFTRHFGHVLVDGHGSVDLGLIPLSPLQALTVELRSSEPVDFSEYTLQMVGADWPPIQRFGEDGLVVVPDLSPARWQLTVDSPNSSWFSLEELTPGGDWHVVFDVSGQSSLRVLAKDSSGSPVEPGHSVVLLPACEAGRNLRRTRALDPTDGARFTGVAPGPAAVLLMRNLDGQVLAAEPLEVTGGELEVVLVIPDELDELLVLGQDGRPLERAYVQIYDRTGTSPLQDSKDTDDHGRVLFAGLDRPDQAIGVWHQDYGWHPDLELRTASGGGLFVQLEPATTLSLRVLDGTTPLAGVRVMFRDASNVFPLNDRITDAAGVALHEEVGDGSYRATIDHPGLWRSEHVFNVSGKTSLDVQVRRVGSLEVRVRTSGGAAVAGQTLELVWDEDGSSVHDWLMEGRVESGPVGESTDSNGRWLVEGLPRGSYSWSATTAEGDSLAGNVTVEPGAQAELAVVLP